MQNLAITCDATVAENLAGLMNQAGGTVTQKPAGVNLACNGGNLALGDQVTVEAYGTGAGVVWQVVATAVAAAAFA